MTILNKLPLLSDWNTVGEMVLWDLKKQEGTKKEWPMHHL